MRRDSFACRCATPWRWGRGEARRTRSAGDRCLRWHRCGHLKTPCRGRCGSSPPAPSSITVISSWRSRRVGHGETAAKGLGHRVEHERAHRFSAGSDARGPPGHDEPRRRHRGESGDRREGRAARRRMTGSAWSRPSQRNSDTEAITCAGSDDADSRYRLSPQMMARRTVMARSPRRTAHTVLAAPAR